MTPYVSLIAPAAALAAGLSQNAAFVQPQLPNVNPGPYGSKALADFYAGGWSSSPVPLASLYSAQNGVLTLENPGVQYAASMATISTASTPGNIPLLPMNEKWCARARYKTSHGAVGVFPAWWSEPIQHNQAKNDKNPATGEEMWLEIDFNEGGAGPGHGEGGAMWGGMIAWWGTYPNYQKVIVKNPYTDMLFDPSSDYHAYDFVWNPNGTGQWWIDDNLIGTASIAGAPGLPAGFMEWITKHQNYLILNATGSPPYPTYDLSVREVSTWVAPAA
jgi:hypothetical protein